MYLEGVMSREICHSLNSKHRVFRWRCHIHGKRRWSGSFPGKRKEEMRSCEMDPEAQIRSMKCVVFVWW